MTLKLLPWHWKPPLHSDLLRRFFMSWVSWLTHTCITSAQKHHFDFPLSVVLPRYTPMPPWSDNISDKSTVTIGYCWHPYVQLLLVLRFPGVFHEASLLSDSNHQAKKRLVTALVGPSPRKNPWDPHLWHRRFRAWSWDFKHWWISTLWRYITSIINMKQEAVVEIIPKSNL